ncbi:hypothetical protein [Streptomyces zhihengii]
MSQDLQAICDTCLTAIADGDGHVWIDQDAADKAARYPDESSAWPRTEGGIPWNTTHDSCAPAKADCAYAIPVARINTWPSFLHWTAQLMNKGWLNATNWDLFILHSVEPQRGAVSGLRPINPQDLEFRGIGS